MLVLLNFSVGEKKSWHGERWVGNLCEREGPQ